MLTLPEKLLFIIFAILSIYLTYIGFSQIIVAVRKGQPEYYSRSNRLFERIREAFVRTIGQTPVLKSRPLVGVFHSFIFYGFTFYLLVNLIDLIEGLLPPSFAPLSGSPISSWFRLGSDVLGFLVLVGVIFFVWRRFVSRDTKLERFNDSVLLQAEVRAGGIRMDSLIVAGFIFFHVGFRLFEAGSLLAAEGRLDPWQPVATLIARVVGFGPDRIIGWHIGWWVSLGLILLFLPYFVRSKHIHIFVAPIRLGLGRRAATGEKIGSGALDPLNFEDENVEQFGVAKLEQLRWSQVLDAYACIQCNRCTNVCPAHETGKALAPSAIEINKRYELNSIRATLAKGAESPRPVMEFALSESALWACTTCGACVGICPVGCEPLIDIVDLRRDAVMTKAQFPQDLNSAFRNLERAGNPWGLAQDNRKDWAKEIAAPTVEENPDFDVLYWVGCAGAYDPSAQKIARAFTEILHHAKVRFAILGNSEKCTGDLARRAGNEYLYQNLGAENVQILNAALGNRDKRVVATCPHCFNALANDYPQLGGKYRVMHHTQLISELVSDNRLPELILDENITYHDPCYLGRHNGIYDAPRQVLNGPKRIIEMQRSRENSFCCGAGGAQFWKEEEPGNTRVTENRFQEAQATGAQVIAAGCPFCKSMLSSSESAGETGAPLVLDVAELVAENLRRVKSKLGIG
ncbi:MAG: (Fe-S)-binding protein [Verrucomicrobia bacterium]|nr:(Fe-S)-binding protein [Verrucomicrobiota bacterium]